MSRDRSKCFQIAQKFAFLHNAHEIVSNRVFILVSVLFRLYIVFVSQARIQLAPLMQSVSTKLVARMFLLGVISEAPNFRAGLLIFSFNGFLCISAQV